MRKSILITGASGFIGSATVERALELGYDTWAGIRKSSSRQYLQDQRIRFIDLYYADKERLKEQLAELKAKNGRFDYIVHIAGLTKAPRSSQFYDVNFHQTQNFVDALIETDMIPDAFFFMSSLSVMGPGDEKGYTPMRLEMTPSPNTEYGRSKLMAENYLKSLKTFPYVILRPTGVYGPRDRDYLILMKAVNSGLDVGAGFRKQLLSFIYVEDLANVVFQLIDKGVKQKEYFVADGDVYTDSEFNTIVREALHKKHVIRLKVPLLLVRPAAFISGKMASLRGKATTFNSDKYRIMKQRNWSCDITPLKEDINFKAQFPLKRGVAKTVEWYKKEGWI